MADRSPGAQEPLDGVADPPLPFDGGRFARDDGELALVRRRVLVFYILAPAVFTAAVLAGFSFGLSAVMAAGAVGLGATAVAVGGLAVLERRLFHIVRSLRGDRRRFVVYEGLAAIPMGLAWIVAGATLAAGAVAYLFAGGAHELRAALLERPGFALLPAGAFLLAQGLGFVVGFPRRSATAGQRVADWLMALPARLGGLLLVVLGALLLAAGFYERLLPAAFGTAMREIASGRLPFAP